MPHKSDRPHQVHRKRSTFKRRPFGSRPFYGGGYRFTGAAMDAMSVAAGIMQVFNFRRGARGQ